MKKIGNSIINNANKDFQDFSKCDYRNHWSFSILFKNIMICEALIGKEFIVEIGASNSIIPKMLKENFNYSPHVYKRFDIDSSDCEYCDITDYIPLNDGCASAVVMSEVIEHVYTDIEKAMNEVYRILVPKGIFILTTPTPPDGDLVWPDVHEYEFPLDKLKKIISNYFKIEIYRPWHNRIAKTSQFPFPSALNKAVYALSYDIEKSTQIFMIARKL